MFWLVKHEFRNQLVLRSFCHQITIIVIAWSYLTVVMLRQFAAASAIEAPVELRTCVT